MESIFRGLDGPAMAFMGTSVIATTKGIAPTYATTTVLLFNERPCSSQRHLSYLHVFILQE